MITEDGEGETRLQNRVVLVVKLSQGRKRDSDKEEGKPWLPQPAAGIKSQGGEAVECISSLPLDVQQRERVFIFWLSAPSPCWVSVDPGHTLTFQLSICSASSVSASGFQEQQQQPRTHRQLTGRAAMCAQEMREAEDCPRTSCLPSSSRTVCKEETSLPFPEFLRWRSHDWLFVVLGVVVKF